MEGNGPRDDSFFAPTPGAIRRTGRFLQLRRNRPALPDTTADSSDLTLADESYLAGAAGGHAANLTLGSEGVPVPAVEESYEEGNETQDLQPEEEEEQEGDTTYPDSESSAAFDPDEDPEGWAERLDELAGVLEVSEAEARALRWGPAIGLEKDGKFNGCLAPVDACPSVADKQPVTSPSRTSVRSSTTTWTRPSGASTRIHRCRTRMRSCSQRKAWRRWTSTRSPSSGGGGPAQRPETASTQSRDYSRLRWITGSERCTR